MWFIWELDGSSLKSKEQRITNKNNQQQRDSVWDWKSVERWENYPVTQLPHRPTCCSKCSIVSQRAQWLYCLWNTLLSSCLQIISPHSFSSLSFWSPPRQAIWTQTLPRVVCDLKKIQPKTRRFTDSREMRTWKSWVWRADELRMPLHQTRICRSQMHWEGCWSFFLTLVTSEKIWKCLRWR